jgi:hypothetical protein
VAKGFQMNLIKDKSNLALIFSLFPVFIVFLFYIVDEFFNGSFNDYVILISLVSSGISIILGLFLGIVSLTTNLKNWKAWVSILISGFFVVVILLFIYFIFFYSWNF